MCTENIQYLCSVKTFQPPEISYYGKLTTDWLVLLFNALPEVILGLIISGSLFISPRAANGIAQLATEKKKKNWKRKLRSNIFRHGLRCLQAWLTSRPCEKQRFLYKSTESGVVANNISTSSTTQNLTEKLWTNMDRIWISTKLSWGFFVMLRWT